MASDIGFILSTYDKPHQSIRLVKTLNRIFDRPPIVCHHNFSQCALSTSIFPENVSFVQPHTDTKWAQFSFVESLVRSIKQMYETQNSPDWFVLLSGSDYPIKSSAQVVHDLNSRSYDAHIRFERIDPNLFENNWQRLCFDRYCTKHFSFPSLTRRLRPTRRVLAIKRSRLTARFFPFSSQLRCFAGSTWFSANRRAAEHIVEFHETRPDLANRYRKVYCPDESYFQTILANASHLRLNNNNWRYIDFSAGGAHPRTLDCEDLPKLLQSSAHFARKFDIDFDARILDELDAIAREPHEFNRF